MAILNLGSLNIDRVFRVPRIVAPGETIASHSLQIFAGGKGANQSVALARAGAEVIHAGKVGPDGRWLLDKLGQCGVDTNVVLLGDSPTGQARSRSTTRDKMRSSCWAAPTRKSPVTTSIGHSTPVPRRRGCWCKMKRAR